VVCYAEKTEVDEKAGCTYDEGGREGGGDESREKIREPQIFKAFCFE
jgi:hypothetical protein